MAFTPRRLMRGASGAGGYQISRSLRFNSADSAYLNRTPATNGSGTKGTFNFWVKRSNNRTDGEPDNIYQSSETASNQLRAQFDLSTSGGTNNFRMYGYNSGGTLVLQLETTAVLRDPSAWYCITVNFDTTQATSANRAKVYINGVEQTAFTTATYPTQNTELGFFKNLSAGLNIGSNRGGVGPYASFYLTEFNCIDGTQLTPSYFGETNAQTGVWQPKRFSGSPYGTNGFYLNFSDNSNTTAATLGKDYSGNGNNWTPNNFSVTAGVGNDSMVDVPTPYGIDTGAGGTVRGNYATLNPLKKTNAAVITNGNLNIVSSGSATNASAIATITPSSGYYYWEMTCAGSNTDRPWGIGFSIPTATNEASAGSPNTFTVSNGSGSTVAYYIGASLIATLSTAAAWAAGDVISVAWDSTSTINKIWIGRNGVWYPSTNGGTAATNADVTAGNYQTFGLSNAGNTDPQLLPLFTNYGNAGNADINFGQRPFAYTAPSGFKALCTQNLPTPTIGATTATQAGKYFNAVTYTGTNATQSITTEFQPDLVWLKTRSAVSRNTLFDAVRGVTKVLWSDSTDAEGTANAGTGLTSLNSNGFTLGTEIAGTSGSTNVSGVTYVAWNWNAGGSTVTNTTGSISAQVRANPTAGFSVVTWTAGSGAGTVGHGLGATPKMIITKIRSTVDNWYVYHQDIGNTKTLFLDTTNGQLTTTVWNNTSPTSSVFTYFGSNTQTYVAYCFAEVAGYSKFGSYTGNGSADGPFVYTGFRPAYVLAKKSSGIELWFVLDSKRGTYNVNKPRLNANNTDAESTGYDIMDFTSNGFKFRNSDTSWNANGDTYIFAAFAEAPFKYALAR